MIRNYIKIAWRNLWKNKAFTAINLVGLATGFAVTLLIIQYVRFEFSYENPHAQADNIVRLTTDYMDGETVTTQDSETNPPLGARALAEIPEVVDFTRAYPIGEPNVNVKVGNDQVQLEKVFAVDSSFFSMFTYPLIQGSTKDIFKQAGEAVISENTAKKLFNSTNVVGKTVEIPEYKKLFTIVGVSENSPSNTHLKFDMVFSYPSMLAAPVINGETENNWNGNNTLTYLLLAPNANYENFTRALKDLNKELKSEKKLNNKQMIAQKIKDIHLYSKKTFEIEPNGDASTVFILLGVAILVILSAFVNYINLATSRALDRAKEVGLRKVVGASKEQLTIQFLLEALLFNLLAGLFAVLFIFIFKTTFIHVASLPGDFSIFGDAYFWLYLISFVVLSLVLSGAYPAFILSSFKPVSVLKGSFSHSTKGALLRKSLVVFQFTITTILLIQTFTVDQQLSYMRKIDLGVDIDRTIVVTAPSEDNLRQHYPHFKQDLLSRSTIKNVALSSAVPGEPASQFSTTTGINLAEIIEKHDYIFYINSIDAEYIPAMGMDLLAGKNFSPTSKSANKEVIVNEEAIRLWGLQNAKEAIGKKLQFLGQTWTILGVIKDYYQETPKSAQIPIIEMFNDNVFSQNASIQFSGGDPKEKVAEIEAIYKANFPGAPFNYFFQDAKYEQLFRADVQFQNVFGILTGFVILIACIGLFGLASFTVLKRTKEIGIRKVIGASTANLLVLLSKDFVKTVGLSIIIGMPITYFISKSWLQNFANRIDITWWLFVIPALFVLVLVILSISAKTIKAAIANPVKSLRTE